jgi:hypothetical protein
MGEPQDLDLRPGGVHRSSIYMWIQRCMSCGYCATDISRPLPGAQAIVKSDAYSRQLINIRFPDTVNAFLCWAMALEGAQQFADAGWASLYGAWVCDDDPQFTTRAAECRLRAIGLFRTAAESQQRFARTHSEEARLLIDLLRRTRQFDDAMRLCRSAQQEAEENNYSLRDRRILMFEEDCIAESDSSRRRIDEALEGDE